MIIIWGKKIVKRKLGFVGEFCPYCRGFQAMKLTRVGLAGHVYYLSVGQGDLVRYDAECLKCRGTIPMESIAGFENIQKRVDPDTERLLSLTQPNARTAYAERLELEQQVLTAPLTLDPAVRANLIFEPFAACALSADEMGRGAYVDVPGIISVLIAGGVTIVAAVAISKLNLNHTDWIMLPFGVGAAGFLGVIIVMSFSGRRRIRKLFLPRLRQALKPLNPTREDLEPFWPQLKGHILGKSLKMEDFVDLRY